ncbi:DUF1906 domain-containing protein [Sporolactobacillus sp. THM7-4]|nr:DUF1906 domain-containing protein [Sporolactobacillus sp. THM7-4]
MKAVEYPTKLTDNSVFMLKEARIESVGRFLGDPYRQSSIDIREAELIGAAGISIFSIWKPHPEKHVYYSSEQAQIDGQDASILAHLVGQTYGTPIFFSVDHDPLPADYPAIRSYFQTMKTSLKGFKVGVYGPCPVIDFIAETGLADFFYQTPSWSGGKESQYAHMIKSSNNFAAGIPIHYVKVLKPGTFWKKEPESKKTPIHHSHSKIGESIGAYNEAEPSALNPPAPGQDPQLTLPLSSLPNPQFPGYLIKLGSIGIEVCRIQREVGVCVDGVYGPITKAAVKTYQKHHRLYSDGIVGPLTWRVMF